MRTATLIVNLQKDIFEKVEIVRFGGGILSEMVRIKRADGHKVWVPKHHLLWTRKAQ